MMECKTFNGTKSLVFARQLVDNNFLSTKGINSVQVEVVSTDDNGNKDYTDVIQIYKNNNKNKNNDLSDMVISIHSYLDDKIISGRLFALYLEDDYNKYTEEYTETLLDEAQYILHELTTTYKQDVYYYVVGSVEYEDKMKDICSKLSTW